MPVLLADWLRSPRDLLSPPPPELVLQVPPSALSLSMFVCLCKVAFLICFIIFISPCVSGVCWYMNVTLCMWKSENNPQGSVLSFHHVRDQTQAIRLDRSVFTC